MTTARCRLRPLEESDAGHIWSATRRPGFNDGMIWDTPRSIEDIRPVSVVRDLWSQGKEYTWAIESGTDFVGMISIRREEAEATWSIGFWIRPDRWNRGYATEAADAVVEVGFRQLGATTIRAAHATWNRASGRVLAKIGMRFVGENPRGFRKRDQWVAESEYEITRESWQNGPAPIEVPIDGTLDLHTFRPRDVKELVPDYLAACRERGILQVRIVHGKGSGTLRKAVHSILRRTPGVASFRQAGEDGGGWGATIVVLRGDEPDA